MQALILVLDGAGCGEAPDAAAFGDAGANTLGHVFRGEAGLELPTLFSLGLWKSVIGDVLSARAQGNLARWGRMRPASRGKDSITGHWEIAGAIQTEPFAVFPEFPEELVSAIERDAGLKFLGNCARHGLAVIEELGEEHLRTGKPILYTSADSVMQIAAHDRAIPAKRLAEICRLARRRADKFRIGRVIARPFTGAPGAFARLGRQDYPMVPPRTVLNAIAERGLLVHGIGHVKSLFAGSGITRSSPAESNVDVMAAVESAWEKDDSGLVFANLSDFDSLYGHRRDLPGFARALADFDEWLEAFLPRIEEDDLVIIIADHGNDPTFPGNDHTREEVPLLVLHGGRRGPLGTRKSFADVASTLAEFFGLRGGWTPGKSFLR